MKRASFHIPICRGAACGVPRQTAATRDGASAAPTGISRAGFTLLEMIGVLAIIAIIASVIGPNVIRSIDRAAVRAEVENLHRLGESVKMYLRERGTVLNSGNWGTQLSITYADVGSTEIITNRRLVDRRFVYDAPSQRLMLFSSMRTGLNLPLEATLAASFAGIWNTPPDAIPPIPVAFVWPGWNLTNAEYLVIERINLQSIFLTDLQTFPIKLTNPTATPQTFRVYRRDGTFETAGTVTNAGTTTVDVLPQKRIDLYRDAAPAPILDLSYFVDAGHNFQFDATTLRWGPLP